MGHTSQPPITDIIKKSTLTTKGDIIQQGAASYERLAIGDDYKILRRDPATDKLAYVHEGKRISETLQSFTNAANVAAAVAIDVCNTGDIAVKNGDIYLVLVKFIGGADDVTRKIYTYLTDNGSTCTYKFNNAGTTLQNVSPVLATYISTNISFTGIAQISADGNLNLRLSSSSIEIGSTIKCSAGDGQITILALYKNN